ncbi:hypothetical protein BN938_1227 [Mucinivorans hirudinis]|uniref:DUF306 domain-containing protein n=1 Tax=Mucinivorans hirudinis TaxID=1433126 RepID=A0A060R7N7_9BACT|nr:hypothetical protein BN938_1227 [Mucinivorans hirudinis]
MFRFFSLIAISIVFTACCTCRKGSPVVGNLEKRGWELVELYGKPITASGISLRFDAADKMIYGTAPCNNFFGGYSLFDKGSIEIKNVGSTMKMCPDSQDEDKFVQALHAVVNLKIEGEFLLLLDEKGEMVAVLKNQQK